MREPILIFIAKHCPQPPPPKEPGAKIFFRSAGLRFGETCLGANGWTNITGSNGTYSCQSDGILAQARRTDILVGQTISSFLPSGLANIARYRLKIASPTTQRIKALLSFTQPIDASHVKITKNVSSYLSLRAI
jgi:hypothetical protein